MKMTYRVLLGLGIVALDLVVFFLPLTALFLAYIFIYNPPWFRELINSLDEGPERETFGAGLNKSRKDHEGGDAGGM